MTWNKEEWERVEWERDDDVYHLHDGPVDYMVYEMEPGEWAQLEKWVGDESWAVLGTADTAEDAKKLF